MTNKYASYKLETYGQLNYYNNSNIRWLDIDNDFHMIKSYYKALGCDIEKEALSVEQWRVCAIVINSNIVSYAGALYMSEKNWEIGAVSTLPEMRNNGYAKCTTSFIAKYILSNNKIATLNTNIDNLPMQRVAEQIGMVPQ